MRSLGTVIVVAIVVIGCSEVLGALGVTLVDIPADSLSVAEGQTWQIPLNISGCDKPPDDCVTWHSDIHDRRYHRDRGPRGSPRMRRHVARRGSDPRSTGRVHIRFRTLR